MLLVNFSTCSQMSLFTSLRRFLSFFCSYPHLLAFPWLSASFGPKVHTTLFSFHVFSCSLSICYFPHSKKKICQHFYPSLVNYFSNFICSHSSSNNKMKIMICKNSQNAFKQIGYFCLVLINASQIFSSDMKRHMICSTCPG